MMKRALAIVAFGSGYVLGAKAGRERYDQIRQIALRVKDDPNVRNTVEEVGEFVREHGAEVTDKITGHHEAPFGIMRDPLNSTATP